MGTTPWEELGVSRATYFRNKMRLNETPVSLKVSNETPNETRETKSETNETMVETNKCHGCGKEVGELICICLECVQKGVAHESLGLRGGACLKGDPKFDGHNGNVAKDITREEMVAYLKKNPKAFVPNWYSSGLPSRNAFFPRIINKLKIKEESL